MSSFSNICSGILGVAVGAALVSHNVRNDDTVSAKHFIILSESGEKVGELGSREDGAHLVFNNADGEMAVRVASIKDKAGLETFVGGQTTVEVGKRGSEAWVSLMEPGVGAGASLTAVGGVGNVHVVGQDHTSSDFTAGDPIGPSLMSRDKNGHERFMLYTGGASKPIMLIHDKDDKEISVLDKFSAP